MKTDCNNAILAYSLNGYVGLFFVADDGLLLHACSLAAGEPYGDFVNYTESHDAVWRREYFNKYHVDFDYFPRGRIIYNRVADKYKIFYDACANIEANEIYARYTEGSCGAYLDEHYKCHKCNRQYVI
jgi:hypothetical protein